MGFVDDFGSGNPSPATSWLPGMFAEIVLLTVLYRVLFFHVLRGALHARFSKAPWWGYLSTFNGLFCKDVQKEVRMRVRL